MNDLRHALPANAPVTLCRHATAPTFGTVAIDVAHNPDALFGVALCRECWLQVLTLVRELERST